MRTDPKTCHPTTVSCFYDKELDSETYTRVKAHIDTCPECGKQLSDLIALSEHVRGPLAHMAAGSLPTGIEDNVLSAIRKKQRRWWENARELLFSRKILIPATALVSLSLLMFILLKPPSVSRPSAIITSLSGDTASIIILETPETGHTILWFTEDS